MKQIALQLTHTNGNGTGVTLPNPQYQHVKDTYNKVLSMINQQVTDNVFLMLVIIGNSVQTIIFIVIFETYYLVLSPLLRLNFYA